MKNRATVVGLFIVVVACVVSMVSVSPQSSGQTAPGGAAAPAPAQVPAAHEVWMALRSDGQPGSGGATDPFDASSVEKFNALFERFAKEYGDNLTIHIGPGVFYGDRLISPRNNWKFRGAGRDITVIRTRAGADAVETVGIRPDQPVHGVEVSDITFDFNAQNLRKANRVFVYFGGFGAPKPIVDYFYAQSPAAWSDKQSYKRDFGSAVVYKGAEYICIDPSQGKEPVQGKEPGPSQFWSVLRPCDPAKLPVWEKDNSYSTGDAVALAGKGYICVSPGTKTSPATDTAAWQGVRTDRPDPRIYTVAVFMGGDAASVGNHRAYRCKAINGHGSSFFGREAFVFGLGGNDSTIEDCQVTNFLGDYASLIVVFTGQNCVIRNCSVRGDGDTPGCAYGGWGCQDTIFENNYSDACWNPTNIDSLSNRNVTFRGNTFMRCGKVGILVNVGGGLLNDPSGPCTMVINGNRVNIDRHQMDGLFIYDNLVELVDDCPFGGIQVQQDGLSNVKIHNNVIRTHDGKGHGRRAIGVWGKAFNVQVSNNTCDPDMYCEIAPPGVFGWGNVDLQGQLIKGLEKLVRPGQ